MLKCRYFKQSVCTITVIAEISTYQKINKYPGTVLYYSLFFESQHLFVSLDYCQLPTVILKNDLLYL